MGGDKTRFTRGNAREGYVPWLVHDEHFSKAPKIPETPNLLEEGSKKKTITSYKEEN